VDWFKGNQQMGENMNKEVKVFGLIMLFFIMGGVAGFLLQTVLINMDYSNECSTRCQEFIDEHCFCNLDVIGEETPKLDIQIGDDSNG